MEWNGETITTAIVGAGGAWMVGAGLTHRAGNFNPIQRRGLLLSGAGFLMSAASARWLQGYGRVGIAFSLVGTMVAMMGMYLLLKERVERRSTRESDTRK